MKKIIFVIIGIFILSIGALKSYRMGENNQLKYQDKKNENILRENYRLHSTIATLENKLLKKGKI